MIKVKEKPTIKNKVLNKSIFSLKNNTLPKYINKGVLKLIAIACDKGIRLYALKSKIIVIPPNSALKIKSLKLDLDFTKNFCFKKKGNNKMTLKKFLKKDCCIGSTKSARNFIKAANIENRKQESINKKIGYI